MDFLIRSRTPPLQSSSASSMTREPVDYEEGRTSGIQRSGDTDVYQVRASPPGSDHDYDTGPSLERLVMAVAEVKSAVNHFAETLILDMNKYPEELKQLKQRIRQEVQGDVDRANHWKFLVQAFVCQRMFEGFETENGLFGMEHFDGQRMSRFISFADFTKYKDKTATISELFSRDSEDGSFLGRYCFKKFKSICVDPVTNHSLAVYEQEWSWVEAERHPQSEFYQSFLEVAVSVWVLHRLVHSFEQGWRMLGWATFPKGIQFSMKSMESVADENEKTDVNLVVGFLVIPGFQVSKSVVKCEVYLRNKNNPANSKLMDGSKARLGEIRARSYLKDAEECTETVQKMFFLLKFNNEQCKYLFDKLYAVVQRANLFLKLSGSMPVGTTSSDDSTDFVEIFKLLMVLGKQIESFVEGCCRDDWIQAGMVLTNVWEYVSSLGFNLDLCKIALGKDRATSGCLTLDDVDSMNQFQGDLVKRKAISDARRLTEKVILALNSLSGEDRDLASYLLQRLLKISPSISSENGTLCSNLFVRVRSGDQVGRGASATIFKAMWLGTRVAKKTFRGSENVDFEKEIQILSRLCHPNVTSMFCCAKNERNCSIIMELMDGDLSQLMDKRCQDGSDSPPFPILEAVDVMLQIGEGVNYLHSQGIVHRDLKSRNILYLNVKAMNSEIGYVQVKVADFGISKESDTNTIYSDLTCNTGTNRWMPPEIITLRDGNEGGLASNGDMLPKYPFKLDSYSFALVCYEILVGREPFWECHSPIEVKRRVLNKERPTLPCKSSECPVMLKALIEKCWNHEPTERPAFAEICRELKYIKYSLLAGGSMTHALDDTEGQAIDMSLEHLSSGKTWVDNPTPPLESCMNSLSDVKMTKPRVRSLEKSFSDKTPANYQTSANYPTPPPKSSLVRSPSDSRGSLSSSSSYSGYSSRGAENVETSSNYWIHSQTPVGLAHGDSLRSKSGLLDSRGHSQTSSHGFLPQPTVPVYAQPRSRLRDEIAAREREEERRRERGYQVNPKVPPNVDISESKLDVSLLENPTVYEQGIVVNQVWPLEKSTTCKRTKLNIIFFEGNVGESDFTSIKDTWVQRENIGVCWPQDWLPMDLGNDIRVLLLKYRISDYLGLEDIVSYLQEKLIFSDTWNQNQEWENPIVLVGHSLGCAIIQNLVVRLHHMDTIDSVKMQANALKAFIQNLIGCFFYAPPMNGFVASKPNLRVVFGGLKYSKDLFLDFAKASPKLRQLLEDFMLILTTRQIPIRFLLEGKKTRQEMVVVAPKEFMEYVLEDSNHSEVCQPTSKDHRSYKEFLDFMSTILQNQGVSNLNSYHESRSCKSNESDKDSNNDESFIIVDELDTSFSIDPQSSREPEGPNIVLKEEPDTSFSINPQSSRKPEGPNMILKENEELVDMVKQQLNEIDNVAEMQEADAMGFNSDESEVLIICNLDDKDDTLVFHLLDGQSMARVVGVGLDYAKVILRNGVDIEVKEIERSKWESAWSHSKAMGNTLYKTMKVKVPMQNDNELTRAVDQKDHVDTIMARPLLWDVAKYFMLQKLLVALSNSDAGGGEQSSKNGQGQGNGSGNSNDTKSSIALLFHAFQAWFSMQFIKRGGRKDDGDENGDVGHIDTKKVDFNGSHATVKVDLLAVGYSFKTFYSEDYGIQIANKSDDLEIKCYLDFDFFKNEDGKKISLTMAHIRFGLYEDPKTGENELEGDRYGAFHDEFNVYFSVDKPKSIGISMDVDVHGCKLEKIFHTKGSSNSRGKGKEVGATLSIGGGFVGASMNGGVGAKLTSTTETSHSTSTTSEYSSKVTEGNFNVQDVSSIQKGSMGFRFLAPRITIEDPASFWSNRDYRNEKRLLPPFQSQTVQFFGSWEPRSDEKLAKYHVKASRMFGEIMRTEVNVASTNSSYFSRFLSKEAKATSKEAKAYDYKKLRYEQEYEKALYLNHEMTHWVNYKLSEKEGNRLTTFYNVPCPLVVLDPNNSA